MRQLKPLPAPLQAANRLTCELEPFRNPEPFHPKDLALRGQGHNQLVPPGALEMQPAWLNLTQNGATVQFVHRCLALSFVVLAIAYWWRARTRASAWLAGVALLQACLGVATLLTGVSVPVAAVHQANALALFSMAVWGVWAAEEG